MNNKTLVITLFALFTLLLSGCGGSKLSMGENSMEQIASATPNIEATAHAAVEATTTAMAGLSATVNAAVAATAGAVPTSTPAAQVVVVTQQVVVTPTPAPVSTETYLTLSEEELAQLIEESVEAALIASQQAAAATTQATSDGSVSAEETVNLNVSVDGAEELIGDVEAMIAVYAELYGEYATQTVQTLEQIESDLSEISSSLETTTQILEQGSANAQAAVEQLNAAAQNASENAAEAQEQVQGWAEDVKNELDQMAQYVASIQPNEIPQNRDEAIDSLQAYLDTVKLSANDRKISPNELQQIAQLGANTSAGLRSQGDPQMVQFADKIDAMTRNAARGQVSELNKNFEDVQRSKPSRDQRQPREKGKK